MSDEAAHVREARQARGWTQRDLAAAAGVAENTVVNLENGSRKTRPAVLARMLDALELGDGGYPRDVGDFLRIAGERLAALDDAARAQALSHLYPLLLAETPVEEVAARIVAEVRDQARPRNGRKASPAKSARA